jgi:acyl-CoA thioester hydrolase
MGAAHQTSQKLRFCDTDGLGHVNNAVYAVLYEAGRAELMREARLLHAAPGFAVVIARLELDFLREMNWPAEVRIDTAVHRIGAKSINLRQLLLVGGELVSRSASVLAVIDISTRRAVPITEEWRGVLARWQVAEF